MPARIQTDILAQLRNFANGGDKLARCIVAMLDGTYFAEAVTIGTETVNVIAVTGQIHNMDGSKRAGVQQVLIKSYPPAGAGTMTITGGGSHGTAKKGSGTTELWLVTESDGSFKIDVLDAAVEDCLLRMETDNGEVNLVKLTFTA